jgi:hypothetical protein
MNDNSNRRTQNVARNPHKNKILATFIYFYHILSFMSYKYHLFSIRKDMNFNHINPLTPELNPLTQRCLTRFFTGDFASWTMNFVNTCVKKQQMQQLFIQFINYVWYLLHVLALHSHLQETFLVPSERCSIEEQSIEYCGWACCV